MTYQPHMLGVGMSVFDQLPREIRDKCHYKDMHAHRPPPGASPRILKGLPIDRI